MSGSIPPCIMDRKLAEARHALLNLTGPGTKIVHSALVAATGRIKHLETRLGETETMRDRIAMQLLPGTLSDRELRFSDELAIEYAYELADKVLVVREQGSAGALGETTSPDFSVPQYEPGDQLSITGVWATVVTAISVPTDAPVCAREYEVAFANGRKGRFTGTEIAAMQAGYPRA